jgi:ABC-type uncharacterized transport system permease subunit
MDVIILFHNLFATLTLSVLCLAGLQAVILAIQEKRLHAKQTSGIIGKLPPLQTMEIVLFQIVTCGFVLLTLLIASSLYFFHTNMTLEILQKIVLALVAWLVFGLLLVGRYYLGWRGRKAIYGTLLGVTVLIVIYFGSLLLL